MLSPACCLLLAGCGYSARPGLAGYLKTVYVKPFENKIDLTQLTSDYQHYPVYRHGLETEITKAVMNRFQFTGLLRPTQSEQADSRLEGELVEFRRDALHYDASQQVEEWRLNIVVNIRFYDLHAQQLVWEETRFTGDTTYFALGATAESESTAIARAIQDLARRIVEHAVENW
ncbi:MAG: LptE family protein [Candidatus Omnitrophica bacterium]|nr:LptE family protein [Candidatus Omnitrophota bacterium]